jgi:tetratricopeptide (TPR) repeat protein
MHDLERAGEWFQAAIDAAREWNDPTARTIQADLLNDRGVVLLRQERYAEAESVLREGLREAERLYAPDHPNVIVQYGNLAGAIRQQGGSEKLEASLPIYEKARRLAIERYGPDHPQSVAFTYNLGNAYRELGRVDRALAMHREALQRREALPENHMFQGLVHLGLGQSELTGGNPEVARDHLQAAVDRLGELVGKDFLRRIQAMEALADAHEKLGETERAAALRQQAAALKKGSD